MLSQQPNLNEQEWSLILELLLDEQEALPAERRRTDSLEYVEKLDQRRIIVDELIQRLKSEGLSA